MAKPSPHSVPEKVIKKVRSVVRRALVGRRIKLSTEEIARIDLLASAITRAMTDDERVVSLAIPKSWPARSQRALIGLQNGSTKVRYYNAWVGAKFTIQLQAVGAQMYF